MKFTKASIERLQAPAGKDDHFEWDDATPGFGIRIRGKRRTWVAQIRALGQTRRLAIGNVAQIELEAARTAARKFFAEATLGHDPAAERATARVRAANTLGVVVDRYLDARTDAVRKTTLRHVTRYLRKYFAPLHSKPIDNVTRADVATVVASIAKEHGKSSAARARSSLSAFYAWALREGIASESNPVAHTNSPSNEKPRERTLSPSEIRAIWHALPNNAFGHVVRLLFLTGCRRSEIGNLEWAEVDLGKSLVTIPPHKTKNHREHRVPLTEEAVAILRAIPRQADSPFVFGPSGFTRFSYYVGPLCMALRAGEHATDWRLHDIRRTVRSELGEQGTEPWVAEQILNHARGGIEQVYNRAKLEKQMRQALQMWAERLREIVEGVDAASNVVALHA